MDKTDLHNLEKIADNIVEHEGVVSKISKNKVTVSLNGNVNCDGCKAKAACGVSESNDHEIEIYQTDQTFELEEKVTVILEKQLGIKAVFWAYVLPFILIISTLLISLTFFVEWLAGLLALSILIPYYLTLFVLKNEFKKAFKILILKYN